ncbi:MAG: hypothetical protein AB1589_42105, partial [Cyanobacteriota bacterium]
GTLTGIPNENGRFMERTITLDPDLMSADFVFEFLGMNQTRNSASQQIEDEDILLSSEQSKLAFMYSLPSEVPKHEQSLSPQLQAILDYAKKLGGPVKVRDIQRRNLKELVEFDKNNAINVREYLEELARLGRDRLEGEGSELRFEAL